MCLTIYIQSREVNASKVEPVIWEKYFSRTAVHGRFAITPESLGSRSQVPPIPWTA